MFILDSLDNVEEDDKQFFEATDDGKFKFNRAKLETAAKTPLDKKNRELLAKIAKSKDLDDGDIERIKKLKAKPERLSAFEQWLEAEDEDGGGEGDPSKKKTDDPVTRYREELKAERKKLEAQKATELEAKDKTIGEWQAKWKAERLSNNLRQFALDAGVFKEDLETFLDLLVFKNHFDLSDDGDVVFLKDGEPSATSPDKAMAEDLRKKYPRFYEAQTQGGSGADGGGKALPRGTDWHKLSPEERMAFGRKQQKARA